MATVQGVITAAAYFIDNGGYFEKASNKNLSRSVSDFAKNKGSANYTYFGVICGLTPAPWCAEYVTNAVLEACGGDKAKAKAAMWGVYPYTACNQLFDAGLAHGASHYSHYQRTKMGKPGAAYKPRVGDVIVFSDNGTSRDHTGLVYAVDANYVYTYEGNTSNMARTRSYALTDAYIYGYVTLNLDGAGTSGGGAVNYVEQFQSWLGTDADGQYGPNTKKAAIRKHQQYLKDTFKVKISVDGGWGPETYYYTRKVQKGDNNTDAKVWQGVLYCLGYDPVGLDGNFGENTRKATAKLQEALGLNPTGIADPYTWAKAFGYSRPAHKLLSRKLKSKGAEVAYLQELLNKRGFAIEVDGVYGKDTEAAVKQFQMSVWPTTESEQDGECGPKTWAAIE